MNLKSCGKCGVVYDKDKINWRPAFGEAGDALPDAVYDGAIYPYFFMSEPCPVCKSPIFEVELLINN